MTIISIRSLTKKEKKAALKAEYEPKFKELSDAWVTGNINGDLDGIISDRNNLMAEYVAKLEVINNG